MTTYVTTQYVANGHVNGKAKGQAISDGLKALLTHVPSAGDINWTTVTWSSISNDVSLGYEVFYINDSLHATKPVYMKFEYGTSGGIAGSGISGCQLWVTIGTGWDGSAITGTVFSRTSVYNTGYGTGDGVATTQGQIYMSNMDGSALTFVAFPTNGAIVNSNTRHPGGYFVIERSRDVTGAATGQGIFVQYKYNVSSSANGSGAFSAISLDAGFISSTISNNSGCVGVPFSLSSNVSIANGSSVPIFSGLAIPGNGVYWVPRSVVCTALANVAGGQILSNMVETRDYIGTGQAGGYSDAAAQRYATAVVSWY